jgi:CysZ protein
MTTPPDLRTASASQRFVHGFSLPITGARMMVERRELWPYAIGPVLLCGLLLGVSAALTLSWGGTLMRALFDQPDATGWLARMGRTLWWMGNALIHLVLFGLLSVMSLFLTRILASPLYDRLSARVEAMVLGRPWSDEAGWTGVALDVWMGIAHSVLAVALYLALSCPLLLLHLIPFAGSLAYSGLGGALASFFIARETLDYSLSRRRFSFTGKLRLLWTHLAAVEGLGLASLIFLWVPFVNLLSMPAAVIGGTLLYCQLEQEGLIEPR